MKTKLNTIYTAILQHVIDEKNDLDSKLSFLSAFALTATFGTIPHEERSRLNRQHAVMTTYSQILGERIDAANRQPKQDSMQVPQKNKAKQRKTKEIN